MKKGLLFLFVAVLGLAVTSAKAQTASSLKFGVFDAEMMMQAVPEYATVDSLLRIYQRDSLGAQYEFLQSELKRLDEAYKVDSAAGKAKSVLDMQKNQREQVVMRLVYWQQIAQEQLEYKRRVLADPIYQRVITAYKKVLDREKYTLVFKPNTYEVGGTANIANVFALVAKEMKIPLIPELGGAMEEEQQTAPAATPAKPATAAPAKR